MLAQRVYGSVWRRLAFLAAVAVGIAACAGLRLTPEHARARQLMQKNMWDSARVLLEAEVKRNPQNYEAWYDLGTVRKELGDIDGMLEAYRAAEPGISAERRKALPQIYYVAWAELYNTAVELYNRMADNRDTTGMQRALRALNNAIKLKPEAPENYDVLGRLHELRGDTAEAIRSYQRYLELLQPAVDFAKRTGLSLGMARDSVIALLGKPVQSRGGRSTAGDSMVVDLFVRGSDSVYVASMGRPQQPLRVEGWRLNLPATWTLDERFRYAPIALGPYVQLATIYYNRRNYDRALEVLEPLEVLTPTEESVQNFRIQIYRDQGKLDQALRQLEELVARNPNNKFYRASLGLVLLQMERYEEAAAQYEAALQIDPQYDIALFNAAAALKNRAAQIQREERERKERDPKYKENEQRYFPLLVKAAGYFERYRNLPDHRNDLSALEQLVNIYETLRDNAQLTKLITELEALEAQYGNQVRYWELLGGVYARRNQLDKAERAYKRADALRK